MAYIRSHKTGSGIIFFAQQKEPQAKNDYVRWICISIHLSRCL